jgi:CubicO group peptidase (beta-lactamase class C family)
MQSVANIDEAKLPDSDPVGYMRYSLGPLHPAPKEAPGWLFAAGELAMTASDLAKWDISVLERKVLKPASYAAMETEVRLKNGLGTNYGLGIGVDTQHGHRALGHGGEVSGFTAQNTIFPDDRAAVVVLTNQDAAGGSSQIADKLGEIVLRKPANTTSLERARAIFAGLQQGKIDRGLFTSNANAYFSQQALEDFASSLGPLGTPTGFTQSSESLRGGMTFRAYKVVFPNKTLRVSTFEMADGKLEQYQVAATE